MKLPVSISSHRQDRKNGGEYVVLKDADGAWIGDIRAEHIGALLRYLRPEEVARNDGLELAAQHVDAQHVVWSGTGIHPGALMDMLAKNIRALKLTSYKPQEGCAK